MADEDYERVEHRIDRLEAALQRPLEEITQAMHKLIEMQTESRAIQATMDRHETDLKENKRRILVIEKKVPLYDLSLANAAIARRVVYAVLITGLLGSFMFVK